MGQKQSQAKQGKDMPTNAYIPDVPIEQTPVAITRHAQDPRALHHGESNTQAWPGLQKDVRMTPFAIKGKKGGSNPSRVSGATKEPESVFATSLGHRPSNATLKSEQKHVRGEGTSTNRNASSFLQTPSLPDTSNESCLQGNAQWSGEPQASGEVGLDKSIVRSPSTGEKVFEKVVYHEKTALRIYCPKLINVLRGDAVDNPDLPPTPASLQEPYESVVHRRKRLQSLGEEDTAGDQHARLLLDFVRKEDSSTWDKIHAMDEDSCIDIAFQDIWILYPPGTTVFTRDDGGWRAYKIGMVETRRPSELEDFQIIGYYLDFDETGHWLVPQSEVLSMRPFSSERSIETLEIIPEKYIHLIHNEKSLRQSLSERGAMYWKYRCQPVYQEYIGNVWPHTSHNEPLKVVVDYSTASKHVCNTARVASHARACPGCLGNTLCLSPYAPGGPHDRGICEHEDADLNNENIREERLIFCPSKIWAFSLRHKTWKTVQPQHLHDIEPDSRALEKLLWLKSQHEESLPNILRAHCGDGQQLSPEVIAGKAEGIKILLYGRPGTGKSFTVECLAEAHRVPLYTVTCGELGTEPDVFGERLQEVFLRAANWRAILVLDQAETLVENRTGGLTLNGNALVSIFLHHLDYFKGLVFITSRPLKFDPAFTSRLHMPLEFPDFTLEVQKLVWLKSIDSLEGLEYEDKTQLIGFVKNELQGLDEGAYNQMNGRQIRSCLTAASVYAQGGYNNTNNGGRLKVHHIVQMLKLGNDFRKYLENEFRVRTLP